MIDPDRTRPFVREVLGGDVGRAVEVLRESEALHGLRWVDDVDPNLPENQEISWYEAHLWPFLTETHLVLSGGDLIGAGFSLIDDEGIDRTPTWRLWGEVVAAWANTKWLLRPVGLGTTAWSREARPWNYLDFYNRSYLGYLIDGYDEWCEAALHVMSENARR